MDGTDMHAEADVTQIYLPIEGTKQPYRFDIQPSQL